MTPLKPEKNRTSSARREDGRITPNCMPTMTEDAASAGETSTTWAATAWSMRRRI